MLLSHSKTWRYIGREFFISFSVAFLFFFFLFFLNQILVMAEEIFAKKVAFWDVLKLILYSMPVVIAFSFPFGSLVGALMAVGRLAAENELLAFGSLGIPPRQLLVPLLVLGIGFSLVSFVMNDYFMPLGNMKFVEIYRRILYSNPALELEPYSVKRYEDTTIITGGVQGRRISDIFIIDRSPEGNRRIISARDARLDQAEDRGGAITLTLDGVFTQVSNPRDGDRYDYTLSDSLVYTIALKNITSATIGGLTPSSMSSADVWRQIKLKSVDQGKAEELKTEKVAELRFALAGALRSASQSLVSSPSIMDAQRGAVDSSLQELTTEEGRSVIDQSLRSYLVEFNRKFSMPAACLVFAFFAFPIGLRARRSGRTVGFAVGLLVAIVYWGMLIAGQTFGVRMSLSPAFSMWFPDAVVLAAGAAFFLAGARR
jgi:lipopolysaccharide export system permease protein